MPSLLFHLVHNFSKIWSLNINYLLSGKEHKLSDSNENVKVTQYEVRVFEEGKPNTVVELPVFKLVFSGALRVLERPGLETQDLVNLLILAPNTFSALSGHIIRILIVIVIPGVLVIKSLPVPAHLIETFFLFSDFCAKVFYKLVDILSVFGRDLGGAEFVLKVLELTLVSL